MKNLIIRSTAVLALMTATSAFAQDFDGFYLGGSIGQTEGSSTSIPTAYAGDAVGTTFGVFAGYNFQTSNNLVVGAEIAYKGGRVDHNLQIPWSATHELYTEDYVDVKGKLGYVFSPNTMSYVVAGYSAATGTWNNPATNNYALSGFNYGVGVEQKITPNVSLGLEVIKRDMTLVGNPAIGYTGMDYSVRAAYHF